jgi:hypothetical protein
VPRCLPADPQLEPAAAVGEADMPPAQRHRRSSLRRHAVGPVSGPELQLGVEEPHLPGLELHVQGAAHPGPECLLILG